MPVDGQTLGAALTMAAQAVAQRPRSGSQILLMTSGLDRDGQQQLAEHASALGAQLSILGVGTRSGAPVPLAEGGFLRDAEGRILLPRLNSQQLAALARQHGARYHSITTGDRDLDYLLQPLQRVSNNDTSEHRALTDQGHWLVLLLLPIAALGARRGWLGLLLCVALLPADAQALGWDDLWQRADQQAMQLLDEQQPAEAAQRFRDPAWRAYALHQAGDYQGAAAAWWELARAEPAEPAHHFNRGTALALAGDYQGALEAYENTLTLAPGHDGARHNRRAVEDYLERLRQQQEEEQTQQETTEQNGGQTGGQRAAEEQRNGQAGDSTAAVSPATAETPEAPGRDPGTTGDQTGTAGELSGPGSQPGPETKDSTGNNDSNGQAPSASHPDNDRYGDHSEQERQQALQQWLLEIPDNPAELLRRKFLYQHLQQQDAAP